MTTIFTTNCLTCNKAFSVFTSKGYFDSFATRTRKYCQKRCQPVWNKGTGHPYVPTGRRTWSLSVQAKENIRKAILARPKESYDWARARRGPLHHNWKGGQKRYKHTTTTTEYKTWRLSVFQRDGYSCQSCDFHGGYLEAHHIKSWAKFPELRFETTNGLTLCKSCHAKTDNYKGLGKRSVVSLTT